MRKQIIDELKRLKEQYKVLSKKELKGATNCFLSTKTYQCILNNDCIINREKLLKGKRDGSAVIIVPITENKETILVVQPRVFREDTVGIEVPAGYIDANETEIANSTHKLYVANSYSADFDISVDELRCFRSWLAEELLKFNVDLEGKSLGLFSDDQIHMLEYYKNSMYNDVIKYLNTFGVIKNNIENYKFVDCGCSINSNDSDTTLQYNSCNATELYKNGMHDFMVNTFANSSFWLQFTKEFLMAFKKRIDNILKVGFKIPVSMTHNIFTACKCSNDTINESNDDILKSLSKSLDYMINDNITGNKNFINDTLRKWSSTIYEKMYWK